MRGGLPGLVGAAYLLTNKPALTGSQRTACILSPQALMSSSQVLARRRVTQSYMMLPGVEDAPLHYSLWRRLERDAHLSLFLKLSVKTPDKRHE